MKEIAAAEHYQRMDQAVDLYLDGLNETMIAKQLGIPRAQILKYIKEFNEVAHSDPILRQKGRERVNEFDEQINKIVREVWKTVKEAENSGDLKTKTTLLKNLSDILAKRVEVLQKSGMINDAAMGDEIARMEENQQILVDILRTVLCDVCKNNVASELAKVTKEPEEVVPIPRSGLIVGEILNPR